MAKFSRCRFIALGMSCLLTAVPAYAGSGGSAGTEAAVQPYPDVPVRTEASPLIGKRVDNVLR
jgi:hypothetical protein